LNRNEKTIVLFERHCHATEKSEAIACARSCQLSWLTTNKVVDPKRIIGKNWRAEEEERHKGSLTPPKKQKKTIFTCLLIKPRFYAILSKSEMVNDRKLKFILYVDIKIWYKGIMSPD
jgi:hypothetical protein